MMESSRQIWSDWCLNTSLHGPGDALRARDWLERFAHILSSFHTKIAHQCRLVWLALTIFAVAMVIGQLTLFAQTFFDPINTWSMEVSYIKADGPGFSIPLPNFTICNLNKVAFVR